MNAREPNVREPSTAAVTLRGDLVCTPDISHEPPGYTIEDPLRGKFYRVGVPEWTFLQLLDGRTSIAEAVGRAAGKLGPQALAEHEALALCRWLLDCQLAYPAGSDQAARLAEAARRDERRRMLAALNPLAIQIPLLHPDRLLARLSRGLDWIFSGWFFAAWSVAVVYAMYLAVAGWDRLTEMSTVILDRDNWLRLAAAWLLLKVLHELAHGLACKRYGGNVPTAGITLILFFPLAYVDVTSSWRFRSKWQRIVTAAAGMYVEWFVAALAMIVWSSASPGLVQHMALNVAVTAGLSTVLFNGNPLVRFDGYFIASDLAGVPNLYSCSQQYLVACIQKYVLGSPTPSPAWPAGRAWLIRLYAPAALAWRVFFYLALAVLVVGCTWLRGRPRYWLCCSLGFRLAGTVLSMLLTWHLAGNYGGFGSLVDQCLWLACYSFHWIGDGLLIGFVVSCGNQVRWLRAAVAGELVEDVAYAPRGKPVSRIPVVVQVYGVIIMVLAGVGLVLTALQVLLGLAARVDQVWLLIGACLSAGIQIVMFRLGQGLGKGERQAVYGLCVLGGLAVLAGVAAAVLGQPLIGLGMLLWVLVFYVPPIASAFSHWNVFE